LTLALSSTVVPAFAEQAPPAEQQQEKDAGFRIEAFYFTGNTLYTNERLREELAPFTGSGKSSADVEKARDALEKFYHDEGYPTALVNIPEQTIGGGVVTLQVIESRIGKVTVTGNRYFSTGQILAGLPSLAPGEILYAPALQRDLVKLNGNPDLKVVPSVIPSKEVGVIDVALKVEDHLPLHGNLELNDRNSANTTELRLSALVKYDNLWHKEHSLSFQYQVSPQDTHEVQVYSSSYIMPLPWDKDQHLVIYGVHSDNNTNAKEFNVVGSGSTVGLRYLAPLAPRDGYSHNLTAGFDYKKFDSTLNLSDNSSEPTKSPIHYFPFLFGYSAALADEYGATQLNATLNFAFRGLFTEQSDFEEKRFKGKANYVFLTAGVERSQKLPAGMGLYLKLDGQLASEPLVDNEEYAAGGMESVRGYLESQELGDNALHGTLEILGPDLAETFNLGDRFLISPYLFADFASIWVKSPLPGQDDHALLYGVGPGVRGHLFRSLDYQLDWGIALADSGNIRPGDSRVYFKLKYNF